jgi:hypothetical protein
MKSGDNHNRRKIYITLYKTYTKFINLHTLKTAPITPKKLKIKFAIDKITN